MGCLGPTWAPYLLAPRDGWARMGRPVPLAPGTSDLPNHTILVLGERAPARPRALQIDYQIIFGPEE